MESKMMKNNIMLDEGFFGDIWNSIKSLRNKAESDDPEEQTEAKEEAKALQSQVKNSRMLPKLKTAILAILIGIIGVSSASAKNFDRPSHDAKRTEMFSNLDKEIADAEAKYGPNFGSVIEVDRDTVSSAERLAAVIDSKGTYGVTIKHVMKKTVDGEEMKIFKFTDGSGLVWTRSGVIQVYNRLGNKVGDYWGSSADKMVSKAQDIIDQHKASVHEAINVLTKAGYTLLKD